MKKKGFTLIELLAVIVILAIIALIATPLVLKYIEKSRKESKVDSAYSFVRNLETEIANFAIKNNGKKYTTDKESIKELGLDITVKGENPEDGKVCISSVGQVEKGVFQYGKYYVSYDGKKGSISDKDTYDNFSCSDNVAKGEEVLSETLINFTYNESYNMSMGLDENDYSFLKLESSVVYNLIIDDTIILELMGVGANDNINGGLLCDWDGLQVQVENNRLNIGVLNEKLEGGHKVRIEKTTKTYEDWGRTTIAVDDGNYLWIKGMDFVAGDAKVLIKDTNQNIYVDETFTFTSGPLEWNMNESISDMGIVIAGVRTGYSVTGDLYKAIGSNNEFIITIEQEINGTKKETKLNVSGSEFEKTITRNIYYFGNGVVPFDN